MRPPLPAGLISPDDLELVRLTDDVAEVAREMRAFVDENGGRRGRDVHDSGT